MNGDRYARQRLIEGWNQERLHQARLLVIGAGALGNETLKNLALLGIGHITLVDIDQVETSNLSRTVLFTEQDIGKPKVDAAAAGLMRLNPEIQLDTIFGDIFLDVGLGFYRHSDLVIGCLDNLAARAQVGRCASLAGIPYLDGGMWAMGGEVRWFMSKDAPCFDCTLSDEDLLRAEQRLSCTGFREQDVPPNEMPTVATTSAIIGGLIAQEAVRWLHGYPVQEGKALVYNGQALTLHRAQLTRKPNCRSSHFPYLEVIELPARASQHTPRQLLQQAHRLFSAQAALYLNLGRDFLLALTCPNGHKQQEVFLPWAKVSADQQPCPQCGAARRTEIINTISEEDILYLDWPLARLGVPAGEVLAVHAMDHLQLFELSGDIEMGK